MTVDYDKIHQRAGDPDCLHCILRALGIDLVETEGVDPIDVVVRMAEALGALMGAFGGAREVQQELLDDIKEIVEQSAEDGWGRKGVVGHA